MSTDEKTSAVEPDPSNTADPEATLMAEGAPRHDLLHGRPLGLVMGALMLTLFLAALDQTIVATALPRITSDLGGLSQLAWVVTAYLLASTASTPIWGKISDIYGRKPMLQVAIVVFLAGSIAAGAAQSMEWLILTRGLQGLGGGGLMVLVMAVIADVIPPRERGRYTGLFGGVFAIASVAGPLLGGFFVESLSWRWIFYINLPIGIAAFFVIAAVLKVPVRRVDHSIDYFGAVLMVAGVSTLLLVAQWGGSKFPWGEAPIWLMVVGAIILLAAFVWREVRAPEPLVPMSLFRNHVFSVTSGIGFIVGFAMFGGIIFLPLYLQIVRGSSPTMAGLEMLPMMAGLLFASVLSGRLIARLGRYKIFPIIGTALAALGMFLLSTMTFITPYWQISIYMLLLGLGIGNVMQVLVLAVQNSVNPKELGVATSGATFFRSIGGTFGTAIFGAVLANGIARNLAERLPVDSASGIDPSQVTSAMSTIAALPTELRNIVIGAFTDSLSNVFLTAVPILVIAFILALFLKDVRLRGAGDHEDPVVID